MLHIANLLMVSIVGGNLRWGPTSPAAGALPNSWPGVEPWLCRYIYPIDDYLLHRHFRTNLSLVRQQQLNVKIFESLQVEKISLDKIIIINGRGKYFIFRALDSVKCCKIQSPHDICPIPFYEFCRTLFYNLALNSVSVFGFH